MTKSTSIIPKLPCQTVLTPSERLFSQTFIRDFRSPHARQNVGKSWKTYYHNIPDEFVKSHISGNFWLGTKAAWYPTFYNLDIDRPTPELIEKLENRLEKYGISEGQRLYMTSPSYAKTGNFRIYFSLEYRDKPPTFNLGYGALCNAFSDLCEIYPQKRRKDRLPCGRDQDLLINGSVLTNLTWEQELHWLLKLDSINVDLLPHEPELFDSLNNTEPIPASKDVAVLITNGLQQHSTRHVSQFQLLSHLWRSNWLPDDAAQYVKNWIRNKHNGLSKDAAQGKWSTINAEIDRQTAHIWARRALPDTPNNFAALITQPDLLEAAKLFPADVVRQKQFINLVSYYRPRSYHDFVFISRRIWTEEIAGSRTYKGFIKDLKKHGILESVDSYKTGSYCRKFRLALPNSTAAIMQDGRNVTHYYDALRVAFNNDQRVIAEATKIDRTTIWRHLRKKPA
jgi:hypothetical protein